MRCALLLPRFVACLFSMGATVLSGGIVSAQDFPSKPIRIFSAEAGGGNDFAARVIAQGLRGLGQPVIVENRASGVIPGSIVAKAPPDGYTLLVYGVSLWPRNYSSSWRASISCVFLTKARRRHSSM